LTEDSTNQSFDADSAVPSASTTAKSSESVDINLPASESHILQFPVTLQVIRVVGYGLLALFLFDLADLLIPFQSMNPTWEFQIFGQLIERIAVPLIALVMVFYGDQHNRKSLERLLLKVLSWACLGFAILLVLLFPLTISNIHRINAQTGAQLSAQFNQQRDQVARLEEQLNQANGEDLVRFLRSRGQTVEGDPQQVKKQALSELSASKSRLEKEFQSTRSQQRLALLKSGTKWSLGALVSATLFTYLWRFTNWARSSQKYMQQRKRSRYATKMR
jgi:hypothetical protein